MKKLIYLFLLTGLVACSDSIYQSGKTIDIRPAQEVFSSQKVKVSTTHLSNLEIVKQATIMRLYNIPEFGNQVAEVGFIARDTVNLVLKRSGTDIISTDGKYIPDFIEATDCVIERIFNINTPNQVRDTIAYIPNSVLRVAETQIKAAYDKKDYDTVYSLFESALTFKPITGEEWRALKAVNQN